MWFVALYRFCHWNFDPEERFIRRVKVHFSVLRQKSLMNEPVPACSALKLLCRATSPFQLFVVLWWCVHLCLFLFVLFFSKWWLVCIKNEIDLHQFATFAVQSLLAALLKQTCVLLSVVYTHSDLGKTITIIILVFLYVGLPNMNG